MVQISVLGEDGSHDDNGVDNTTTCIQPFTRFVASSLKYLQGLFNRTTQARPKIELNADDRLIGDHRDANGDTELINSVKNKSNDNSLNDISLIARATVNIGDKNGMTALHWAALNDNLKVVEALLKIPEIDVLKEDCAGMTAIELTISDDVKLVIDKMAVLQAIIEVAKNLHLTLPNDLAVTIREFSGNRLQRPPLPLLLYGYNSHARVQGLLTANYASANANSASANGYLNRRMACTPN